ncbi:MAG TPA: ABC transporter substrate-binding protein [Candidatus Binatia bacterium]|jgi:ABC-type nitrate/sulfonate/bicarbonate transport system substrate-binding protein
MSERKNLRVIYRSNAHAPLWVLADKSGLWGENGLDVDTSPQLVREKAVESLKNGSVDVISGNHHNLYERNARGEDFVHLAQAVNTWTDNLMVVRDGIKDVQDLRGKKIAVDKLNSHSGLNVWLFLLQEGLDADRGDMNLVTVPGGAEERYSRVLKGEFDATFVSIPHDQRVAKAGGRVIPVRVMPMIRGVTLTTTMSFVKSHEEEIRRLIRGFVDAIHFFLTRKEETLKILKNHLPAALGIKTDEELAALYGEWAGSLERKPYPSMEAMANVFQLALRRNPEAASYNPVAMWDTHYVRELDDSGYIDKLYSN